MKLVEYRKIAKAVEADLKAALAKHGLNMKPFGARIDERLGIVTMKLECVDANLKAADGTTTSPEREYWKQMAPLYELHVEWLDQEFTINRETFRVAGLSRSRSAKSVMIERTSDKKSFVCTPEDLSRAFIAKTVKAATPKGESPSEWAKRRSSELKAG